MTAAPDPVAVAPEGAARRRPAPAVARARARVRLENRRGAWRLAGIAPEGRTAGRLAAGLPALPALTDPLDPVLLPLIDEAAGARIFQAAAAVLAGHRLALAVTPADRAAADQAVPPAIRDFALARRQLSLPLGDAPLADALSAAAALVDQAWRARLPQPLAAELPGEPGPESPAEAAPGPQGKALGLRWPRRRVVLPADPAAVPVADRPARALDAALALAIRGDGR